jgi:RNA polymerase primary sigma factor
MEQQHETPDPGARARDALLTADEERQLAARVAQARRAQERLAALGAACADVAELEEALRAGRRARALMVATNQGLVWSVALRYRGLGLELEDLVQEGNVGLLRAIDRFDPGRGVRFATYAVWWVRQAIVEALERAGRPIRLPERAARELRELERAAGAPGDAGAADRAAGVDTARVRDLLAVGQPPLSLDAALGADGELTLGDTLADPRADVDAVLDELADRQALAAAMAGLSPEQRRLLILRVGLVGGPPRPIGEVAAELGVRRDRALRMEAAALRALRQRGPGAGRLVSTGGDRWQPSRRRPGGGASSEESRTRS